MAQRFLRDVRDGNLAAVQRALNNPAAIRFKEPGVRADPAPRLARCGQAGAVAMFGPAPPWMTLASAAVPHCTGTYMSWLPVDHATPHLVTCRRQSDRIAGRPAKPIMTWVIALTRYLTDRRRSAQRCTSRRTTGSRTSSRSCWHTTRPRTPRMRRARCRCTSRCRRATPPPWRSCWGAATRCACALRGEADATAALTAISLARLVALPLSHSCCGEVRSSQTAWWAAFGTADALQGPVVRASCGLKLDLISEPFKPVNGLE